MLYSPCSSTNKLIRYRDHSSLGSAALIALDTRQEHTVCSRRSVMSVTVFKDERTCIVAHEAQIHTTFMVQDAGDGEL